MKYNDIQNREADMANARGKATKTALDWARERAEDPEHRDEIAALMTEIDVRQDLIALREERGVTQVELAEKLGITQAVVSNLERRRTMDVKLSTLVKAAAALGARVKITFEKVDTKKAARRKRAAA